MFQILVDDWIICILKYSGELGAHFLMWIVCGIHIKVGPWNTCLTVLVAGSTVIPISWRGLIPHPVAYAHESTAISGHGDQSHTLLIRPWRYVGSTAGEHSLMLLYSLWTCWTVRPQMVKRLKPLPRMNTLNQQTTVENDAGTVEQVGINSQPAPTPPRSGGQAWALWIEGGEDSVR